LQVYSQLKGEQEVEGSKEMILQFYMSNADLTFEEAAIRSMEDYASLQQGTGGYSVEKIIELLEFLRNMSEIMDGNYI